MEPREGYEIVTLRLDSLPQVGDILVSGGQELVFGGVKFRCDYGGVTLELDWRDGFKVYRPLPPKDAKDEEIEFLRRALEQAIASASLQIVSYGSNVDIDIEMCGEYHRTASDVPDLYKYLQDRGAK